VQLFEILLLKFYLPEPGSLPLREKEARPHLPRDRRWQVQSGERGGNRSLPCNPYTAVHQALRYRGRSRRQPSRSAGTGEAQFLGDRNEIAVARLEGELAAGRDRGGDGSPAEPAPLSPHSCDVRSAAPCRGNVVIYRKQKQVTAIPAKPFGGRRLDTVVRRRLTTRMQTCG
jgi:hypothetical protein